MTGGAGDIVTVLVQVVVQQVVPVVGLVRVAVHRRAAFGHGHRRTAPGDFVVAGAVALGALKIVSPHVDVAAALRLEQLAGEIGVLDGFAAAAVEVTVAAGLAGGVPHAFWPPLTRSTFGSGIPAAVGVFL
jgi:hypothetical protein